MFNSKAMLIFALLGLVAASPVVKRQEDTWTTCQFVVTQAGGYTDIRDLVNAILSSITTNIQRAWSPYLVIRGSFPLDDMATPLPDGKTKVRDLGFEVESKSAVELIALFESWEGQTLKGYEDNDFTVHEADCITEHSRDSIATPPPEPEIWPETRKRPQLVL